MKTELDIPDDVAADLERVAKLRGRRTAEELVHLVRLALVIEELPVSDIRQFASVVRALLRARNEAVHDLPAPVVRTDPVTGLQVILSPPDAPIHSMTAEQFQALVAEAELEGDVERAGLTVRHE